MAVSPSPEPSHDALLQRVAALQRDVHVLRCAAYQRGPALRLMLLREHGVSAAEQAVERASDETPGYRLPLHKIVEEAISVARRVMDHVRVRPDMTDHEFAVFMGILTATGRADEFDPDKLEHVLSLNDLVDFLRGQ